MQEFDFKSVANQVEWEFFLFKLVVDEENVIFDPRELEHRGARGGCHQYPGN